MMADGSWRLMRRDALAIVAMASESKSTNEQTSKRSDKACKTRRVDGGSASDDREVEDEGAGADASEVGEGRELEVEGRDGGVSSVLSESRISAVYTLVAAIPRVHAREKVRTRYRSTLESTVRTRG